MPNAHNLPAETAESGEIRPVRPTMPFVGTYVEYGAIIDRTSKGLGYWLSEVSQDRRRIESIVSRSEVLFGFPAEMKERTVSITDWRSSGFSSSPGTAPGGAAE